MNEKDKYHSYYSMAVRAFINTYKEYFFKTKGNSMYPTIFDSEYVKVEKYVKKPKIGDVILYESEHNTETVFVAHRLHACILNNLFILRGDGNIFYDQPIFYHQIIGKVVELNRKSEWIAIPQKEVSIISAILFFLNFNCIKFLGKFRRKKQYPG